MRRDVGQLLPPTSTSGQYPIRPTQSGTVPLFVECGTVPLFGIAAMHEFAMIRGSEIEILST